MPKPLPKPLATSAGQTPQELEKLMSEMRSMRGVIESQLSELVWENIQRRDPTTSVLLRRLLSAGFGASLSRQIAENLPQNQTQDSALNWAKSVLEKNLNTIDDESDLLDKGGVFALIGPTGVGKTTTTAKLAARFVMKHGAGKLGLITTDAYRIGGHEQLRIYGKILGVMVHAVKDEADLKIALAELKGKHTILIDTVGVNQRDEMVTRQIAMLAGAGNHIKRLLCINATSTGETLMDVVNAYRGKGLTGCIMTKMDEAATIGSALDVIIREKLRLYYVANGQRVPEDLHVANKKLLVHHAFKLRKSPGGKHFQFRDEDLPLLMAHAAKMSPKELSLG
jgi:flagellar biosynthesis protein FlhF